MFHIFLRNYITCQGSMQPHHILNLVSIDLKILKYSKSCECPIELTINNGTREFWISTRNDFMSHITFCYMTYLVLSDFISNWFHVIICNNAWKFTTVIAHHMRNCRTDYAIRTHTYNNFKYFPTHQLKTVFIRCTMCVHYL